MPTSQRLPSHMTLIALESPTACAVRALSRPRVGIEAARRVWAGGINRTGLCHSTWNRTPMTLANQLTVLRIVLIPVFVLLLVYDLRISALLVFLLTCISDSLDGYIARTWGQQTTLGAFLDPIADKLLMVTTFVTLALLQALPISLTVVLIARDVGLGLCVGLVLFTTGRRLSEPTVLGRVAVFGQMATVVSALFFYVFEGWPMFDTLRPLLLTPIFVLTALLAVAAGVHYVYQLVRLVQKVEGPLGRHMSVQ
jgi:cardiolipin synthase